MISPKPKVLIACDERVRNGYLAPEQLERLAALADWRWFPSKGGGIYQASADGAAAARLRDELHDVDALIVCHGAPRIDGAILAGAPRLGLIGELEGDRFASRIDLEAAWARNIRTVDTTNASSYPVAEWALALILIGLRNAGYHFRQILAGETARDLATIDAGLSTLTGRRVGLIGCGHMGRRLIQLLRPFRTEIWVYDPYLPVEMAEALGVVSTNLKTLLAGSNVVVCLVPHTPKTEKMLGAAELALLRPRSVFVNVSRGAVVDSAALIQRLAQGDITASLDVFDPEPIPPDSEIIKLPNVFLSPHFGGRSGHDYPGFFALMVDELERFFAGHEPYFELTPTTADNRRGV